MGRPQAPKLLFTTGEISRREFVQAAAAVAISTGATSPFAKSDEVSTPEEISATQGLDGAQAVSRWWFNT